MKHTPGPWEISPSKLAVMNSNTTQLVANCAGQGHNDFLLWPSPVEQEANAKLIAASPDLLEVCQLMWAELEVANEEQRLPQLTLEEIKHIEATIAKVTA